MSVGPQLQLAVLWPWLLMATLQIRLGYSGLALVAAERASAQKAVIRVIPLKMDPLTLEGVFASVAEVTPAEGKLLQFHPLSLCNTSEDEHTVPGFISIVKLERPERNLHPCLSLANKAKLAGERGARAVLFDISDDQTAADQLKEPRGLSHPVVLIWGQDAERLMGVVNNNREAQVKIEVKEAPEWPDYDLWILLTVVSTVMVIVTIFIIRTRCHTNRAQTNVQEETLQAISRLATRTYQARRRQAPSGDAVSTCSSAPVCAICLEEFNEGQELRIITCFHEFHRQCVDPWLQQHQTCPLCMFNIISKNQEHPVRSRENPHSLGPGRRQRHFLRQHPGRALYHFPRTLPQRPPRNCSSRLPHNHPFFHSPELSQLDFGTMRYLPSRSAGLDPLPCHQPPPTRGLLAAQRQETLRGEQAWGPHRPCLLRHQPSCRGLGVPLPAKLSRAVPLQRGIRHGRHPHHSSGSGESYFTEPSGYIPDGPGSDSSSGPCHGSSSDSVLNCTDVSLQALHGSCSTFHSSLSSDYDPFAFCSSEKVPVESHPNQPASQRDLRPPVPDVVVPGRAQLASSHVHYHHHHHRHHHYGRNPPEYPSDRSSQEPGQRKAKYARAKTGPQSAPMQKQTEKMQTQGGGSSSQDASLVRPSSCLPQGLKPYLAATSDLASAARGQTGDVGPQTPQKHYLQIHPSRGKWKGPLDASQSPLPEDPYIIPSCHAPAPSDPTSGNCCSLEMQPLLVSTNQSTHHFVCAPQHSALQPGMLELQEQVDIQRETDCDKPMFPGQISGRDPSGNNTSVYLNCQILQHLQGVKENIPDIYEHSV